LSILLLPIFGIILFFLPFFLNLAKAIALKAPFLYWFCKILLTRLLFLAYYNLPPIAILLYSLFILPGIANAYYLPAYNLKLF